jgi:multidrug efflux pump
MWLLKPMTHPEQHPSTPWRDTVHFMLGALAGGAAGWFIIGRVNAVLSRFFKGFNRLFDLATEVYGALIARMLRLSAVVLVVYGGLIFLTYYGFTHVPAGFIPDQDQGYLVIDMQLPDSASLERTVEVMAKVEKIALETPGVNHTMGVAGQSFLQNAISSNFGGMFITLKPFHERHGHSLGANAIAAQLRPRFLQEIEEARVSVFGAPAVQGLGNTGGFKLMVESRGEVDLERLQGMGDTLAENANKDPRLVGVFNSFRANTPQLYVDIDRVKAKAMGVPLSEIFTALQVFLGGYYVNDFNEFGRTWQVNIQADAKFRLAPDRVRLLQVRNSAGAMVPLGSVLTIRDSSGPVVVNRYNTYTAATINGASRPDVSTGTVIQTMDRLAREVLPGSMIPEWTELTYLQILAGNTAIFAFIGAVLLVFLVLAAQYESWSLPLAVILVVPMCLLGAITGVALAKMDINIFVQIGFVVLVGLASKNAILVVEFARDRQKEGKSAFDAALEASKVRLRPIIMTSFAFILGVVPLVVATGAGAEMRRTLGTAVFSGMLGVTFFGIFLTPVFYFVVMWLIGKSAATTPPASPSEKPAETVTVVTAAPPGLTGS